MKITTAGLAVLLLAGCSQKYAVLISTGNTVNDNQLYHSEYWYDLFLQYKMLRENGFKDENIHVLYGYGSDFATTYSDYNAMGVYGHAITDSAVSKANIQSTFNALGSKVDGNDYLYVWWMGHGSGSGPGSCDLTMHVSATGETVTDSEFAAYLAIIPNYNKRNVSVMTCHSGGLVDNLNVAGSSGVTHTSSTCMQSSASITSPITCNSRPHAEFSYTFPNALREKNPCNGAVASDFNGDGGVSMSEAHLYNSSTMTTSTPQMGDPDSIASDTYIKHTSP